MLGCCQKTAAQMMLGCSGAFNTPTAEMNEAGTFTGGVNFIGRGMIPAETDAKNIIWKFDYNTFNYYGHFVIFDWLEATFRETLLQNDMNGKKKKALREQDRSISVKARVLKEGRYCPGIALGVTDPTSVTGHHPFASGYLVFTKNIHVPALAGTLGGSVGYITGWGKSIMYDGVFGNLRYRPDFFPAASVIVEYDTQGINYGVEALLWKRLGIYAFGREADTWGAGIRYQAQIKYRRK